MPLCALVPIIQDKDWLYGKGNPARGECGMDIPEIHRLARNYALRACVPGAEVNVANEN